jgi:hypothetical protein
MWKGSMDIDSDNDKSEDDYNLTSSPDFRQKRINCTNIRIKPIDTKFNTLKTYYGVGNNP